MGARAYIIKKTGQRWEYIYSHWGADYIYYDVMESIKPSDVDAFNKLHDSILELWDYEIEHGEKVERLTTQPSDFIDISDIEIEAWIVFVPNEFIAIYRPVITLSDVPVGTILIIRAYTSMPGRYMKMFLNAHEAAKILDAGIAKGYIDLKTAKNMARVYITHGYETNNLNFIIYTHADGKVERKEFSNENFGELMKFVFSYTKERVDKQVMIVEYIYGDKIIKTITRDSSDDDISISDCEEADAE